MSLHLTATDDGPNADQLTASGKALGTTMMAMLVERHGAEAALAFATSITMPTLPGSRARADQDRVWSLLTARLSRLAGEAS